ncbi:MAG: aldo/keto reductase [Kofleriaceae bacterium]
MRTRTLGAATVSAVGCGDLSLVVAAARNLDLTALTRALHHAVAVGISLVEVAAEEGAERIAGDAIRALRMRDRVVVATHLPRFAHRLGIARREILTEQLPLGHVQERIEATLRNTRLDALPLAILPLRASWRESTAWPELAGACMRLVREGKVMQWAHLLDDEPATAPDTSGVAAEPFVATAGTFNLCQRDRVVTLARRPLAGGAFAGTLAPGTTLALRDDRLAIDPATLESFAIAAAHLAPLVRNEPPAARSCDAARTVLARGRRPADVEATTLADLALRWVIDAGAIALPRLHRVADVDAAVAAASARPLSPATHSRIDGVFPQLDT